MDPPPPGRRANRRRQCQPRSRAAMSDQHEAEPYVATEGTATLPDTGAPVPGQPRGRRPVTGNAISRAVPEGHWGVIPILAVFGGPLVGAVLRVASESVVLDCCASFR